MSPNYPDPTPPTSTTPPPPPTDQTAILRALTSLLQLHHHQRWLPSTAAHNLASLRHKRHLDTPPPHDTMHHLQHTTQTQQKATWEAMTAAQRRAVYERLLRLLRDAARAARAAERCADGQLLDAFDREFDEAVAALVEGWRAAYGEGGG